MKKVYYVEIPFTGKVSLYIAAESAEAAIDRGLELADINDDNLNFEVDYHRHVVQGNYFHGTLSEASAKVDKNMDLDSVDNLDDLTRSDLDEGEQP